MTFRKNILWLPYYRWVHTPTHFSLGGETYRYYYHWYNRTWINERCVELPFAFSLLDRCAGKRVLEVGHVLGHYGRRGHDVVDKYERGRGVRNADVTELHSETRYDLIVSLSTLEHVGWDESPCDPEKTVRALERLIGLLCPGGMLAVTFPLGYNPHLDRHLWEGSLPFNRVHYLKRLNAVNDWEEASAEDVKGTAYGSPHFAANAVVIGIHEETPPGGQITQTG
jgi:hypothetical protein